MDGSAHSPKRVSPVVAAPGAHDTLAYFPLRRSLFQFRWAMFLALLGIAVLWPLPTRFGQPLWVTVGVFGLYNGLLQLAVARAPRLAREVYLPLLDLLVIAALYAVGTEPAGVTFTLFVLALLSAAVILSLRGAVTYTLLTLAAVILLAPGLASWSNESGELNVFAARLLILPLVGIGAALMIQQLARAQAEAAALEREAERLEELERLRTEFVASISHDLNTPLTAINAGLGLLEDTAEGQLRADQFRLLHNARKNGERLRRLIGDLLTYNQLTAGAVSVQREDIDLRQIAADALASMHALLQHKRQSLTVDLPATLPIAGDARLLERVLVNLLCNAHEHTPSGTHITLMGEAASAEVSLAVHDTGPGIPAEAHEAIFAPFHRHGARESGSGLGLAIVHKLVELHGGRVWVESTPGDGTTFHIVLPVESHQG